MTLTNPFSEPEQQLALRYAKPSVRPALEALVSLDDRLAQILRSTREPMVGQMRLTWWYEALQRLDTSPAPAEPVLQALADRALPRGVSGEQLSVMIDGWEELLQEELQDERLWRHATGRGGTLFEAAGMILGAEVSDPLRQAGEGWALSDLARNVTDHGLAERARALAARPLAVATSAYWSRSARPLGALAHLAQMNLRIPLNQPLPIGSPQRVGRMLLHRITGR